MNRKIPFLDLEAMNGPLRPQILSKIREVAEKNAFIGGAAVEMFEKNFAAYCQSPHCVGASSGTMALRLMLEAYGVRGKKVIVPANTFIATAEAVVEAGAIPIFCDVELDTWLLNPRAVRTILDREEDVIAILAVHLFGNVCNMDALEEAALEYKVHLLVDAAQSHGARWEGSRNRALGEAAAFSFYPGKNLGAWGDAGAVVTSNKSVADYIRKFANHGQQAKYVHEVCGTNGRLDAIQAVVLNEKLKYLDDWNRERARIHAQYLQLTEIPGVRIPNNYVPFVDRVHHLMPVFFGDYAPMVAAALEENNIQYGIHYPDAVHMTDAFKGFKYKTHAPIAEMLCAGHITLPLFPSMTRKEVDRVVDVIKEAFNV